MDKRELEKSLVMLSLFITLMCTAEAMPEE
jgi:hypothetical protein